MAIPPPSGGAANTQSWESEEVQAIAELISSRCAGGGAEHFAQEEPGLEQVHMEFLPPPSFDPNASIDLDESRVFEMRDLVSTSIDIQGGAQVRSRDVLQFVVLAKEKVNPSEDIFGTIPVVPGDAAAGSMETSSTRRKTTWTIPDAMTFNDVVNRIECQMVTERLPCLRAQKWTNMWGRVGLVGLSARDPEHIRSYRNLVEQLEDERYCFTIFPRDVADKRGSISVLLQENFRAFNPMCLPGSLFSRNRGLTGALKVTHIKTYREDEKSRSGLSKKDWKLSLIHI